MATIVAAAGGGNWTTGGTWVGGSAPTAADDAVLASTSGNVTIDTGAVCRSLDCNGYTGTLTHTSGVTLTIGDGTAGAGNRALRLSSGMTYTLGDPATSAISFVSTSATQQTIDYAGKTVGSPTFNGASGSWILSSALTTGVTGVLTVTNGAFDANEQAINVGRISSSNSNTRTVDLSNCAITLSGTGTIWSFATTTNLTFSNTGSTYTITDSSSSSKSFATGTATNSYPSVTVSAGGTGTVSFTGSVNRTITSFTVNGPKIIAWGSGVTTTFTNVPTINSTQQTPVSFVSVTPGSTYTLSLAAGTLTTRYMSILDCIATGGATFIARSSFSQNTTGWTVYGPRVIASPSFEPKSVYFTGVATQNITSTSNTGVGASGNYSFGGWFKYENTGGAACVFGLNFNPVNPVIGYSSTGFLNIYSPLTGTLTTTIRLEYGRWYHAYTTFDYTNGRDCVYLNGFLVYTRSGAVTAFSDGKVINGRFPFSAIQPAKGHQGGMTLHARECTAAEVLQIALDKIVPTSSLRVYYKYEEGTGNLADSSGNSNTGTLTGASWTTDGPFKRRVAASGRIATSGRVAASNRVEL